MQSGPWSAHTRGPAGGAGGMGGARALWWPERARSVACRGGPLRESDACARDAAPGARGEGQAAATSSSGGVGGGTRLSSRGARRPVPAAPRVPARCLQRPRCPRRARFGLLLWLSVLAAAVSAIAAQTLKTTRWCNSDTEPDDPRVEVCFEPSVGPIAGGVLVTVKGMQRAAARQAPSADWKSRCSDSAWWQCTFAKLEGVVANPVPALNTSCEYNYVVCKSPAQTISGDVYLSVQRNDSSWSFPSHTGEQPIFSYYGVSKIEPISGVAGMRPAVDIVLLNRKEGIENWNCMYKPYGPGWNKSNAVPPIRAAGFKMETKRLTCGIPDDILLLDHGAPFAEVNQKMTLPAPCPMCGYFCERIS